MDRRVVRHAVQPEELVKTEAEKNLKGYFLVAAVGATGDEPVERGLPPDDAERQFTSQPAVGGRQPRAGAEKGLVEKGFGAAGSFGVTLQHVHGNFSWFFRGHRLIMPVAQLQSSF